VTTTPRRILIVLDHPGALLHFDETIRRLSAAHEVHLAFLRPGKYADALVTLGDARERIALYPEPPVRRQRVAVAAFIRSLTDYVHYLQPPMAGARYSREKWLNLTALPPALRRRLTHVTSVAAPVARRLLRVLGRMEAALQPPPEIVRFVRDVDPDAVIVSPLVDHSAHQTDYLKAAAALGIPTALLVTSWDNLTSKGRIRLVPDRVVVWNETQRREAAEYHGVEKSRIVLTGAQQFERWLDQRPRTTREEFLRRFDLPADRPFVLFTCSTKQGLAREAEPQYVRRWLTALRASEDALVRDVAVIVRPHPTAIDRWDDADFSDLEPIRVWTRERALPIADDDRADYFDALCHCAALVAINSTSMIEAAICDRPVHTVALPEFALMQHDLMHFHYLLPEHGGFVRVADSFEEHAQRLADDLRDPARGREERRRFVDAFVRPPAGAGSATRRLVEAIVGTAELTATPPPRAGLAMRAAVTLANAAAGVADRQHALTDPTLARASDRTSRFLGMLSQALRDGPRPARATASFLRRLADAAHGAGRGSRRRLKQQRARV
jgi:hypothetical protein